MTVTPRRVITPPGHQLLILSVSALLFIALTCTARAQDPPAASDDKDLDLTGLIAIAPEGYPSGHDTPAASLGSLDDPEHVVMKIEFSRAGAGIKSIVFSDIWDTAAASRQAERFLEKGEGAMPDDAMRYELITERMLTNERVGDGFTVPVMAAQQLLINTKPVALLDHTLDDAGNKIYIWAETAPGCFETVIHNGAGVPLVRVTRRFLPGENYDITLEQRVQNLTAQSLTVQWSQFGPCDLREDRSRYMDRRRFRFGFINPYLPNVVKSSDSDLLIERAKMSKRDEAVIWPNEYSAQDNLNLSWFASSNRYFALAVHPVLDDQGQGERTLTYTVDRILHEESYPSTLPENDFYIFTYLVSTAQLVEAGATRSFDLGVYAGPLDRSVLLDQEPYASLSMNELILYQMSSCCSMCTFQWLAHGLLWFIHVLHDYVVFDWAIGIIILVLVVRTLLHPITKRSQISMQRFGKVMQDLKPEMDKLKKKYENDPKRLQSENLRLMRERGANPMQMLGCLPLFLQTPIWIALYAMLYFAFELRHEAAFYGFFQLFWDWPFLADLSSADHFFYEFKEPFKFLMWNMTGINLLPLLMGAVFFVQQKYMSPPPSPNMSPEQQQQQKLMKIMMVVMFPVMLYSAPSGLTLYILTSSIIGILESRYVRKHIKEMDLSPKPKKPKKKTRSRDAAGKAYAKAIERMQQKKEQKRRGPEKRYKKRDK